MRALIQRVAQARVDIAGETVGEIGNGMLVLVCAMQGDGDEQAQFLARKVANLRIFESEPGKMNLSVLASEGGALVVSQFTLAADTSRGNRPGFSYAAPPDEGERLYELFAASLAEHGVPVQTGRFGQEMQVHLVNRRPGHDLVRHGSLSGAYSPSGSLPGNGMVSMSEDRLLPWISSAPVAVTPPPCTRSMTKLNAPSPGRA